MCENLQIIYYFFILVLLSFDGTRKFEAYKKQISIKVSPFIEVN